MFHVLARFNHDFSVRKSATFSDVAIAGRQYRGLPLKLVLQNLNTGHMLCMRHNFDRIH
jgi:hypothetical protein